MITLALEFSSARRSVAVLELAPSLGARPDPAGAAVERNDNFSSPPTKAGTYAPRILSAVQADDRAMQPLPLIDHALHEAGISRQRIQCVVVGLGPGSYTGIRSAISIAQGWQLGRAVKLLGVSSAAALAAQAHELGRRGLVRVAINAQRDEFYLAAWEMGESILTPVAPLALVSRAEVRRLLEAGATILGPGLSHRFPQAHDGFPDAVGVGKLAVNPSDCLPGEQLEPIYLRETNFVKAPPPRPSIEM